MEVTDGLELSEYLGRESAADSNTVDMEDSHAFSINSHLLIYLRWMNIQRRHYSPEGVTFTHISQAKQSRQG